MNIIKILPAAVAACILAGACTKTEVQYQDKEVIKEVPVAPVANYNYNGTTYSVHTLGAVYADGYYTFLIAREPQKPYNSYINIMIPDYNLGRELDFTDVSLSNRIDYVLLFEDMSHYYSPFFAPKGGKMLIRKADGKNAYSIDIDITLADGKTLKFKYEGEF